MFWLSSQIQKLLYIIFIMKYLNITWAIFKYHPIFFYLWYLNIRISFFRIPAAQSFFSELLTQNKIRIPFHVNDFSHRNAKSVQLSRIFECPIKNLLSIQLFSLWKFIIHGTGFIRFTVRFLLRSWTSFIIFSLWNLFLNSVFVLCHCKFMKPEMISVWLRISVRVAFSVYDLVTYKLFII